MSLITRRTALELGLGAALAPLAGCGFIDDRTAEIAPPSEPGLHHRAHAKGLIFGAATMSEHLDDPFHRAAFLGECKMLVAQNELKWAALRPAPGVFDFRRPDRLAAFAQQNGLLFRGHALVWYISNPAWLAQALKEDAPEKLLEEHIWATAGRYRGKMHSWDVVNEAIEPYDERGDLLRKTAWLDAMGPSYIETAFHIAQQADPFAKLTYNDYGLDYADDYTARRRDGVLDLLERLKSARAPVHALGIQAHLRGGRHFDPVQMTGFLDDVASLGLDIYITELDVNDIDLPRRVSRRDEAAAEATRQYLETVLAHKAVKLVVTWGLSDKYTFRKEPEFKKWCWTPRPLPLDVEMARKPLWRGMAEAFDGAPLRTSTLTG